MDDLDDNQLSRVHYIDCIMEFTGPIEILAVQSTLALNLFGDLGLGLVFARQLWTCFCTVYFLINTPWYTLAWGWYASALDFCAHLGLGLVYIR